MGGRLCIAGTELNKVLNLVSADCAYCTVDFAYCSLLLQFFAFLMRNFVTQLLIDTGILDLAMYRVVQTTNLSQKYEVKTVDCGLSCGYYYLALCSINYSVIGN